MLARPRSKAAVRVSRPDSPVRSVPIFQPENRWTVQAHCAPLFIEDDGETAAPPARPNRLPRL